VSRDAQRSESPSAAPRRSSILNTDPTASHSDLRATAENSFAVNLAAEEVWPRRKIFGFL
ncbi:MAG TPA: hypothetical protein VH370_02270, partial [Humisphaera sp.]|nr:hypothetical protein [Humisphaera sp.]